MKLNIVVLALIASVGISGQAVAQAAPAMSDGPASLAPGDLVRITVWRHPEFSGDYIVAPDGTITHPLMREINVVGIPFPAVEARVRTFLTKFDANPAFVVSPLLRVFVGGEVRVPNVYNVPPGSTVSQLIALAGGPTDRGQLKKVVLVRKQERQTMDLIDSRSASASMEIRSGDQLLVPRRRNLLTDVIGPTAGVVAAAASIVSIILR